MAHDSTVKIAQLVNAGMDIETAYNTVKPDKELSRSGKYKLRKTVDNLILTQPNLIKSAVNAVEETLAMKSINGVKPTVSNRLEASRMVLDRADPLKQINQNINVNASISPVDLSRYLTQ